RLAGWAERAGEQAQHESGGGGHAESAAEGPGEGDRAADRPQIPALDRVLGGDVAAGEDRAEAESGDHQDGRGGIGGEIRGEGGEQEEAEDSQRQRGGGEAAGGPSP